jgi:hypothetical protein
MSVETKSNQNWIIDRFLLVVQFLFRAVYEPYCAAFRGDVIVTRKFIISTAIFVVFIIGIDGKILFYFGHKNIYDHPIYSVIQFFIGIMPLMIYGLIRSIHRTLFIFELRNSFDRSGLRNSLREYPNFISLEAKDDESLKLRLTNNGMSLNEWKSKKDRIEANLRVYIDTIEMIQAKGIIEITFSTSPMPSQVLIPYIEKYRGYKFLVGRNRTQEFEIDFTKDPHLLVAGESGGGKTFFTRQLIATVKHNHPETVIKLFDLKRGGDFSCFNNVERIELELGAERAPELLNGVVTEIQHRSEFLRLNNFSDLESYHKSAKFGQKSIEEKRSDPCGHRVFVVVDEFAELVLSGGKLSQAGVKDSKEALSKISRLGRSCGVHLILTTQRPDRSIVDVQVRSNLTSTVCFRLNDLGGSLAVLGSKAACELPQIKGRGIYLRGADEYEIQSPYLDEQSIRSLMAAQVKSGELNGAIIDV